MLKKMKLLISYAIALITFLVTYYTDPLNFSENNAYAAIPSLMFSIFILIITNMVEVKSFYDKSVSYSDKTLKAVKGHLKVNKIGTPKETMKYVIDVLPITKEVINTSFNLDIDAEKERAEEQFYDTGEYYDFINAIAKFTKNGNYWKDIGDDTAKGRFKKIKKLCDDNNCYKFKITSANIPQINFIVLVYKNNTREVLFNWNYGIDIDDPIVLSSVDESIVSMFIHQHANLWKTSSVDHDSI